MNLHNKVALAGALLVALPCYMNDVERSKVATCLGSVTKAKGLTLTQKEQYGFSTTQSTVALIEKYRLHDHELARTIKTALINKSGEIAPGIFEVNHSGKSYIVKLNKVVDRLIGNDILSELLKQNLAPIVLPQLHAVTITLDGKSVDVCVAEKVDSSVSLASMPDLLAEVLGFLRHAGYCQAHPGNMKVVIDKDGSAKIALLDTDFNYFSAPNTACGATAEMMSCLN